ncbi:RIP metalloprotease [Lichenibacterium minor]|uniref:RIP metalloprotease n=1 Tax=Lichenibacterium minor TaxID=2316528 RepID=A0A4Q2U8Z2_9HYPH|nr:M50 family metallopeptidase [Lichenibacterium minor]RYC32912.1 RIP metalloprotease [Lichenibacterium minor]
MSFFGPVSSVLYTIVPFVFVMTVVVFFHEMGHFLVGRWCGVKVDAFSIGFGPELFARVDRHGTRWRLAAIPLGGYVKFHGDINPASTGEATSAMSDAERATTFGAQPVWERAAVVAAGPLANFLLALVIMTGIFYVEGRSILLPRVASVVADSAAARAGFAAGDVVASIDGRPVASFVDMQKIVSASSGVPLAFEVERGGRPIALTATPDRRDVKGPVGTSSIGVLGVAASTDPADVRNERMSLGAAVSEAAGDTWFVIDRTASYVGGLVLGREKPDQLSGPIGVAGVAGQVARIGIGPLFNLIAILSVSIGLINLVPVPLLDGGHLLYFAFEALRGRPMSLGAQEFGFKVGLALVAMLMIFATYNDIAHITRG